MVAELYGATHTILRWPLLQCAKNTSKVKLRSFVLSSWIFCRDLCWACTKVLKWSLGWYIADVKSRASKSLSILDSGDVCFVSLHFFGMLAVRSFVEGDLSIDCRRWHVLECLEYLDRLRLGVSPGDTSEVFGQWRLRQPTWRWALRVSRQAEVGSRSWRHEWSVWTVETPTTGLEVFESKRWETEIQWYYILVGTVAFKLKESIAT